MAAPSVEKIRSEIADAHDALDEAKILFEQSKIKGAVSRAYYAAFHGARAVLWSIGHVPATHKGVIHLFEKHLVKSGGVGKEYGRILRELHDERDLADYHAVTGSFEKAEVERLVADARRFVEKMEEILKDGNNER